jgi:hypothetical protein
MGARLRVPVCTVHNAKRKVRTMLKETLRQLQEEKPV